MNGAELKKQGQQLALFGAGQVWVSDALDYLRRFCLERKQEGKVEFRFEEFREYAGAKGLEKPVTHKVWGSLPRIAAKEGLIEDTGQYKKATSSATHAHPVKEWRAI